MKCISLWQPWASFVIRGHKQIETRSWYTGYRGLLLIHAAKTKEALKGETKLLAELPFGALLGVVRLVDCRPTESLISRITQKERDLGNYDPGRFGWIFDNAFQFIEQPIPYKGMQGFFEVPDSLLHDVPLPDWALCAEVSK